MDSLYNEFQNEENKDKLILKNNLIRNWLNDIDSTRLNNYLNFKERSLEQLPNNTFFMSYLRYNKMQNFFEEEFNTTYSGDLKLYLSYLIKEYEKK